MIIIPCPDPERKMLEQIIKHYGPYMSAGRDISDLLEKDIKKWAEKLIYKQKMACIRKASLANNDDDCFYAVEQTSLVEIK